MCANSWIQLGKNLLRLNKADFPIRDTIENKFGAKYMNNIDISFFRFVFDCICKLFDCVVGNPGPNTIENHKIIVVSLIGFTLFAIGLLSALFFIDRNFDWKRILEWLVSIVFAFAVAFIYFAIVYWAFF